MSRHQQAFLADISGDLDQMARHALSVLIANDHTKTPNDVRNGTPFIDDLNARLYNASIAQDQDMIWAVVKDMQRAGLSNQLIKGWFVTAIARQLGEDWVNDLASFGEVTIGCGRLQSVVRHLDRKLPQTEPQRNVSGLNCLVVVPQGNQHTLGAVVATDQLRYAGALAKLVLGVCDRSLSQLVASHPFDAVLISASQGQCIEQLTSLVQSSRQKRYSPKVLIGGGILDQHTDLVAATGTDYVSHDVREALDFCTRDAV